MPEQHIQSRRRGIYICIKAPKTAKGGISSFVHRTGTEGIVWKETSYYSIFILSEYSKHWRFYFQGNSAGEEQNWKKYESWPRIESIIIDIGTIRRRKEIVRWWRIWRCVYICQRRLSLFVKRSLSYDGSYRQIPALIKHWIFHISFQDHHQQHVREHCGRWCIQ